MNHLPNARKNEIVVQESDKEILIYDLQRHKAIYLNETAAFVWQKCDGKTTFAELQNLSDGRFTDELIWLTLHRLQAENLLQDKVEISSDKTSRRQMIVKYGGLAVSLQLITTLIAPTSANAQSLSGRDCGSPTPLPAGCNFGTTANDCPTCAGRRRYLHS